MRPDDPGTAELEGERDYQFDTTGRLASITTPCTGGTGTATLESYTYKSTSPAQPAQVAALDKYYLTGAACSTITDKTHLTVNTGQGVGQEGAMTSVVEDPGVVGGPTTTASFTHDGDNQLATSGSSTAASEVTTRDPNGNRQADTTSQGTVNYDYAGADPAPAAIGETVDQAPSGFLTDPNGLNIAVVYQTFKKHSAMTEKRDHRGQLLPF